MSLGESRRGSGGRCDARTECPRRRARSASYAIPRPWERERRVRHASDQACSRNRKWPLASMTIRKGRAFIQAQTGGVAVRDSPQSASISFWIKPALQA